MRFRRSLHPQSMPDFMTRDDRYLAPQGEYFSLLPMRFIRTIMVTHENSRRSSQGLTRGVSVIIDHENDGIVFGKLHHDLRHHEATDHHHGAYMSRPGHLFRWENDLEREPDCLQSYYWQQLMLKPFSIKLRESDTGPCPGKR